MVNKVLNIRTLLDKEKIWELHVYNVVHFCLSLIKKKPDFFFKYHQDRDGCNCCLQDHLNSLSLNGNEMSGPQKGIKF